MIKMSTIEIPEYFRKLFEQVTHDASLILAGIFVILILIYLVDVWSRWREIGKRYGV